MTFDKQLGTATYLIDKLALRVGNEKSEDEADTIGTCSLRVEHIKIENDHKSESVPLSLSKTSFNFFKCAYWSS